MNPACTAANATWVAASLPKLLRFQCALKRPRQFQHRLLMRLLHSNADSAFGREHGLARVRTVEDYRRQVPVRTYDEFAPWIERIRRGEQGVLTSEAVRRFVPSSGSTQARKLIPFTASLRREFSAAIAPWIADMYLRRPALAAGPAYWSVSPVAEFGAAPGSKVPVGFDEDTEYLGGFFKRLVDVTLAVPSAVKNVHRLEDFRYVTMLYLLRCRELRLISVWHPSFLSLLLGTAEQHWQNLLRDIADGSVPIGVPGLRPLCADPARASELEKLGPRELQHVWPKLGLVSCWADAHAASAVRELQRFVPQADVQPKGLIATEGFVSLPYRGARPLALASHYLEFIADDGSVLGAHELVPDGEYGVLVTTGGGLYRYNLRDRVRVDGFVAKTPSVAFVGKEDGTSDMFGEKLSQRFVADVLPRLFAKNGMAPRFSMLAPQRTGDLARYVLFVEGPQKSQCLSAELEEMLCENPHYRYCVHLGQLAPSVVVRARRDSFERYVDAMQKRGMRVGDIKPVPLEVHGDWLALLGCTDPGHSVVDSRRSAVPAPFVRT